MCAEHYLQRAKSTRLRSSVQIERKVSLLLMIWSNSIYSRLCKILTNDSISCVSESHGIAAGGLPHNPPVRELVANKRRFSSAPKREQAIQGFQGWHERGYLPHRTNLGSCNLSPFGLWTVFQKHCDQNGNISGKSITINNAANSCNHTSTRVGVTVIYANRRLPASFRKL
jgi:hypothetical protein